MMKKKEKIFAFVLTACAFISIANGSKLATQTAQAASMGYAEYVSIEKAPIIDGIIDDVWERHDSLIKTGTSPEGTYGYVDILWNETGLYFLADVVDFSLNVSDLCNFWVSETYYTKSYDPSRTYNNVDGAYYLCLNYEGQNAFYSPSGTLEDYVDMTNKYTAKTAVYENRYVVEVYVPLTGSKALAKGEFIGFNLSIDNYLSESFSTSDRESYVTWCTEGWYWDTPTVLNQVKLIDMDYANGSYQAPPLKDETSSPDKRPDEDVATTTGCFANISIFSIVGSCSLLSISFYLLFVRRQKNI